ncbi:NACHT domain-containing protein [Streptomyces formicae]|uniref:Putative signal transduction protein containing Nacht domain n=1 Tax=Streptomyces formicae TaxID=1616117 RepID=A0A291QLF7_9ACTN|nr:NACHT domain-containing protein [Streptomyces formicae]ATL32293.1 putative signal transduction protein containing Nacht domain [Streptomyces formicae]
MEGRGHDLYAELRGLERRARARRAALGLPWSRREAQKELARRNVQLDGRRISDWLPEDPLDASAPRLAGEAKVWALVQLWAKWAEEAPPPRRFIAGLIEAAQPVRHVAAPATAALPAHLMSLFEEQAERGEVWPYAIHSGTGARRSLSAVYIRQALTPRGRSGSREEAASTVEEFLSSSDARHLFIEAGPGSGKSTMMARLAGHLSRRLLDGGAGAGTGTGQNGQLPLWATAAQLASDADGVDQALTKMLFRGAQPPEDQNRRFTAMLEEIETGLPPGHTWLLLVDGLDEVPTQQERARLARHLATLATSQAGSSGRMRIVLTCRPLHRVERAYFTDAGFQHCRVAPFDRAQLEEFALRWFGEDEPGRAQAARYLHQVDEARLEEVTAVPLLAAVAAAVFEAWPEKGLPHNHHALLEQYRAYLTGAKAHQREGLFRQLVTNAGHDQEALRAVEFLRNHLEELLRHAAIEAVTQASPDLRASALDWLSGRVGARARTVIPGWGEQVASLMTTSGLIVDSEGSLAFLHASFAEHLAAEAAALSLPSRFDGASRQWQDFTHDAARLGGPKARPARAALLHYAHRHPRDALEILDWLQRGRSEEHHFLAGFLLAKGSPHTADHLDTYLAKLPDLSAPSWQLTQHMSDPRVTRALRSYAETSPEEQVRQSALEALAVHDPAAARMIADRRQPTAAYDGPERVDRWDAEPSTVEDSWLVASAPVIQALLDTLGDDTRHDLGEYDHLVCMLICSGPDALDSLIPRSMLVQALQRDLPSWAEHAEDHLLHIMNSTAHTPEARIDAAEFLLEFGGDHQPRIAAVLGFLASDPELSIDNRWAAAEALAELGAPHRAQARQFVHQMATDPTTPAYQRYELTAYLAGTEAPTPRLDASGSGPLPGR